MTTDELLREWHEIDPPQHGGPAEKAAPRRAVLFGGMALLALLILLLGLWLGGRGNAGTVDPASSTTAASQPKHVPVTVANGATTTATSTAGHAGRHGGTAAGKGSNGSGVRTATTAGSGDGTSTTATANDPGLLGLNVEGAGLTADRSVKRATITSCTRGGRVSQTADVTLANGLVVHAVPVNSDAGTVSIGGLPYLLPIGATYRNASCR